MGYKIAQLAFKRNHRVILVSGHTSLTPPKVNKFIPIETADELHKALKKEFEKADCLIMCAAVGDFRVKKASRKKIKRKKRLFLEFLQNRDILGELGRKRSDKLLVGFSLETEDFFKNSHRKLRQKNLDLIVVNRLTKAHNPFGNKELDADLIDRSGRIIAKIRGKKKARVAQVLLDKIERMWYLKRSNRGTYAGRYAEIMRKKQEG